MVQATVVTLMYPSTGGTRVSPQLCPGRVRVREAGDESTKYTNQRRETEKNDAWGAPRARAALISQLLLARRSGRWRRFFG